MPPKLNLTKRETRMKIFANAKPKAVVADLLMVTAAVSMGAWVWITASSEGLLFYLSAVCVMGSVLLHARS